MLLAESIQKDLMQMHEKLLNSQELLPLQDLSQYFQTFQERFGPEVLKSLDGPALLDKLHNQSNHDSLVYWLEFKDDEEFPARFGSIAGGSALKFGIYWRKELGAWMTGNPQSQQQLDLSQAVEIARRNRDQIVEGSSILAKLPDNGTDIDYARLQEELNRVAPDVSDSAWGHKYFSLLYPTKLDDYHNPDYQRFYLIKLLQTPPEGEGRYLVAGRYVALARELGMPMNHLTTILNRKVGKPHRYWRIGTTTEETSLWPVMRDNQCVAIGWPKLGDLSALGNDQPSKDKLRDLMAEVYPSSPQAVGRQAKQVFRFRARIAENDIVLACDGKKVLGIGRVTGDYAFQNKYEFPHTRPVDWLSLNAWELPEQEGLRTTVHQIKDYVSNQIEIERRIISSPSIKPAPPRVSTSGTTTKAIPKLEGVQGRIQSILTRKSQAIIYGPPGTGKTYWALASARDLSSFQLCGMSYLSLGKSERRQIDTQYVRVCTFHPSYGYEDFLEGYRPTVQGGNLVYPVVDGAFKQICIDARTDTDHSYYLVIDEINRGDIPRIFGELLTLLEKDKRGNPVLLPLTKQSFTVPPNVFLVGTMNTADRSIALLDTALRRRFGFVELMPDYSVLENVVLRGLALGPWLKALNTLIRDNVGRDSRNLQIGHAYLLEQGKPVGDFEKFARILQDDIIPLVEEYCYEDFSALEKILTKGLVDQKEKRIRAELFDIQRQDELLSALVRMAPELLTAPQTIESGEVDTKSSMEEVDEIDDGTGKHV